MPQKNSKRKIKKTAKISTKRKAPAKIKKKRSLLQKDKTAGKSMNLESLGVKIPVQEITATIIDEPITSPDLTAPDLETENFADFVFDEDKEESQESNQDNSIYLQNDPDEIPSQELTPRQKKILMYISIGCVMAVLLSFWISGIKYSLGQNPSSGNSADSGQTGLGQILEDFTNGIGQIKDSASQPENINSAASEQIKQKLIEEQLKAEIANEMKNQLAPQAEQANQNANLNKTE